MGAMRCPKCAGLMLEEPASDDTMTVPSWRCMNCCKVMFTPPVSAPVAAVPVRLTRPYKKRRPYTRRCRPPDEQCRIYAGGGAPRPQTRNLTPRQQNPDKHTRYAHKLVDQGRCPRCGQPSAPYYLCDRHRMAQRRKQQDRHARLRPTQLQVQPPPLTGLSVSVTMSW